MAKIGDDYPAKWRNLPLDGAIDTWGMYTRECTSFVANRLSVVNKFNITRPPSNWNANVWGNNAQSMGYKVDKNPTIGSVAWWNAKFHVAWVAEISGNNVLIEEYNNPAGSGNYATRWIDKNAVDGYIHFKDLGPQIDLSKYFTNNPGFVKTITDCSYYTNTDFTTKKSTVPKGTIVQVNAIQYSKDGYPRLKTDKGYLTANKAYVQKQDMSNYFTTNPGFVKIVTNDFYYTSPEFSTKKEPIVKGVIVKVLGIEFSKFGYPRLKCEKGYLSANKIYVQKQDMSNYFTTNPGFVKIVTNDFYYTSPEFDVQKEPIVKGVMVKVLDIEFSKWGYPRLKCEKGYLSANKIYVQKQDMSNYFTTNPGFVKIVTSDFYYTSPEFDVQKEPIAKGVMVKVLDIEFSKWGYPRLKCEKGYLSANKIYVQKQDMSNYFTTNPGFVKIVTSDFYYTSPEFDVQKEPIATRVMFEVLD
ncbi:DUF5776 domain-containing protein, partial [Candidatus Enterococcus ikei]